MPPKIDLSSINNINYSIISKFQILVPILQVAKLSEIKLSISGQSAIKSVGSREVLVLTD